MSTVGDSMQAVLAQPPTTIAPAPRHARPPRRWVRPVQVAAVFLGWLAAVVSGSLIAPVPAARPWALFGHLVFLAISFGAVLAVELYGLAALVRITTLGRVASVATSLDPLIWGGLVGLAATGAVLAPDLDRPLTVVKLIAVLAVALNGLWARELSNALRTVPPSTRGVPRHLVGRAMRVSAVSQVGWWSAVAIGFLTTNG